MGGFLNRHDSQKMGFKWIQYDLIWVCLRMGYTMVYHGYNLEVIILMADHSHNPLELKFEGTRFSDKPLNDIINRTYIYIYVYIYMYTYIYIL